MYEGYEERRKGHRREMVRFLRSVDPAEADAFGVLGVPFEHFHNQGTPPHVEMVGEMDSRLRRSSTQIKLLPARPALPWKLA